ncbi:hypothetical protein CR513_55113, partial [Mucuna pruriens]
MYQPWCPQYPEWDGAWSYENYPSELTTVLPEFYDFADNTHHFDNRGSTTSRGRNEIAVVDNQRFEGYIDGCGMCGSAYKTTKNLLESQTIKNHHHGCKSADQQWLSTRQGTGQRTRWLEPVALQRILEDSYSTKPRLQRKEDHVRELRIDNVTLAPEYANESSRQEEEEGPEEEALVELERLLEQEKLKLQSGAEELEIINLGKKEEVRKQMPLDLRQRLVELLKEYADVFAWSYGDMLGLDTTIVEHKLPFIPNVVPVQQQLRRIKLEVVLKTKKEVEKQWNVGFLAIAKYPQWVAYIVPVPKKDGKDLNKAIPKDNFPLPHIDMLVDNTAQHAFYSFMDGFFRYNQIWMAAKDREKPPSSLPGGHFAIK